MNLYRLNVLNTLKLKNSLKKLKMNKISQEIIVLGLQAKIKLLEEHIKAGISNTGNSVMQKTIVKEMKAKNMKMLEEMKAKNMKMEETLEEKENIVKELREELVKKDADLFAASERSMYYSTSCDTATKLLDEERQEYWIKLQILQDEMQRAQIELLSAKDDIENLQDLVAIYEEECTGQKERFASLQEENEKLKKELMQESKSIDKATKTAEVDKATKTAVEVDKATKTAVEVDKATKTAVEVVKATKTAEVVKANVHEFKEYRGISHLRPKSKETLKEGEERIVSKETETSARRKSKTSLGFFLDVPGLMDVHKDAFLHTYKLVRKNGHTYRVPVDPPSKYFFHTDNGYQWWVMVKEQQFCIEVIDGNMTFWRIKWRKDGERIDHEVNRKVLVDMITYKQFNRPRAYNRH